MQGAYICGSLCCGRRWSLPCGIKPHQVLVWLEQVPRVTEALRRSPASSCAPGSRQEVPLPPPPASASSSFLPPPGPAWAPGTPSRTTPRPRARSDRSSLLALFFRLEPHSPRASPAHSGWGSRRAEERPQGFTCVGLGKHEPFIHSLN